MSVAPAPRGPRASRRSLRAELVRIVIVLVVGYLTTQFAIGLVALRDARQGATTTSTFAAELAAASVANALADVEHLVSDAATRRAAATSGSRCGLPPRGNGVFASTHVDLLLPSGSPTCSSLGQNDGKNTYGDQPWLTAAARTRTALVSAPFTDPRTQRPSIAVAAPVLVGRAVTGVLVDFLRLDDVAARLDAAFGRSGRMHFTIVDQVDGTIMTTAEDEGRSGAPVAGSPFSTAAAGVRVGLDGVRRVYGASALEDGRWTVFAGWAESVALGPTQRALRNQVLLALLALTLGTTVILAVDRRVAAPVRNLRASLERAGTSPHPEPVTPSGPAELLDLAETFNAMLATRATYEKGLHDLNAELESRVAERTAQLQRSNTELDRFASLAAHDLQEPLRTITGFADLVAERVAGDTETLHLIDRINARADRMRDLINDLLAYARAGTAVPDLAPTDVGTAVGEAVEELRGVIEETHAIVTVDAHLPRVNADMEDLIQIFLNLIANALKFHRPGATPTVQVSAERRGSAWIVSVTDDGIGIDPRYAERIFEPFRRLHPKEEYPGTGMGLGICAKLVEKMGGRIWVESEPGAGATFRVEIPAA